MSLRAFLNVFTASALLGGLAFWPAACASQRLFSQARSGEHASQIVSLADGTVPAGPSARAAQSDPGKPEPHTGGSRRQSAAGLTLWKDRGYERSSVSFNHHRSFKGNGLGETRLVSAQGEREKPEAGSDRSAGDSAQAVVPPPLWTTGKHGRKHTETRVPSRPDLRTLATSAAHLCGVPVAIFHALIHRESSWRPWVVSSSGAVGLGQIKPSTLRDIDPRLNAWEPWDNLIGSACYLRQQFDRFGTWRKALHAYHGGPNRRVTVQATHDYAQDIIEGSAN